jgi:MinD-like ATPase involved in chromosome partitioning or flagellar assembly
MRSSELARELAELLAARGTDTLLVLADLQTRQDLSRADRHGLVDVLVGDSSLTEEVVRHSAGYDVLLSGSPGSRMDDDTFAAVEPRRLTAVAQQARDLAAVTVVDVPPILHASESQLFCANADFVIVIVQRDQSRVSDLRQALALLSAVDAPVTGAVIEPPGEVAPLPEVDLTGRTSNDTTIGEDGVPSDDVPTHASEEAVVSVIQPAPDAAEPQPEATAMSLAQSDLDHGGR